MQSSDGRNVGTTMKQKILVVEPSKLAGRSSSCSSMLDEKLFLVDYAADGNEAFTKISARPPELVILDARASSATSIEWCRRIKADSLTRDVKVIIVTSSGEWGRVFEAFAAGCDDYMVEPFDRRELELKMKELLKSPQDEHHASGRGRQAVAASNRSPRCNRLVRREPGVVAVRRRRAAAEIGSQADDSATPTGLEPTNSGSAQSQSVCGPDADNPRQS
jgi:DNA-binding response OmpR family regulator